MDVLASVVLLASLLSNLCLANETTVLNLMLITSGGGQYNSSGVEPAVDLAVRLINENDVIPGYQLKIASRGNSSVSPDLTLVVSTTTTPLLCMCVSCSLWRLLLVCELPNQ